MAMKAASQVFRKAALDRLASPEQLDELIPVVDARGWIAALGIGVVSLAVGSGGTVSPVTFTAATTDVVKIVATGGAYAVQGPGNAIAGLLVNNATTNANVFFQPRAWASTGQASGSGSTYSALAAPWHLPQVIVSAPVAE